MQAIRLLFAFSPWIAFWIIAGGHSMERLQVGIVVAALMVVIMGITKLHRGLILWAGVVFFAFALVAVVWLKNPWVIHHLGILASGTLFTATMISIIVGRPFTESYAQEHTPRELWDSAGFIRSSYTVTGFWAMIFLANTMVNVIKLYHAEMDEWFFRAIELAILVSGVVFTTIYSNVMSKRRASTCVGDKAAA